MYKTYNYQIKKSNKLFPLIDELSFLSKNLYNFCNYNLRKIFIVTNNIKSNHENITKLNQLLSSNTTIISEEAEDLLDLIKDISEDDINYIKEINSKITIYNEIKLANFNIKQSKTKKELKFIPDLLLLTNILDIDNDNINKTFISKGFMQYLFKDCIDSKLLHSQSSQQVFHQLYRDWTSFFKLIKKYSSGQLKHKPNLPGYFNKNDRNILFFSNQQVKKHNNCLILTFKDLSNNTEIYNLNPELLKSKNIISSTVKLRIKIDNSISLSSIKEVRIIPLNTNNNITYKVEVVFLDSLNLSKTITNLNNNILVKPIKHKYIQDLQESIDKYNAKNNTSKQLDFSSNKFYLDFIKYLNNIDNHELKVLDSHVNFKNIKFNTAGIDLGLKRLYALTFTNNKKPYISKSKELLSFNQYINKVISKEKSIIKKEYDKSLCKDLCNKSSDGFSKMTINKEKKSLCTELAKADSPSSLCGGIGGSKNDYKEIYIDDKIKSLLIYRDNKLNYIFHKEVNALINILKSNNIQLLVIGKNIGQKQEIELGKTNNQNFINIPHNKFIHILRYKCLEHGILTVTQEESYTSVSSFIDSDNIEIYGEKGQDNNKIKYSGKRNKGIYISKDGKQIHSDINGSYNIIRKLLNSIGIDFNYNSLNIKTRKEYYNNTMPIVIDTLKIISSKHKKPLRSKTEVLQNHKGDAREKPIMNNKINLINLNIIEKNLYE